MARHVEWRIGENYFFGLNKTKRTCNVAEGLVFDLSNSGNGGSIGMTVTVNREQIFAAAMMRWLETGDLPEIK